MDLAQCYRYSECNLVIKEIIVCLFINDISVETNVQSYNNTGIFIWGGGGTKTFDKYNLKTRVF